MQPIMVVDDDDDPEPEVIEEDSCVSPPGVNNAVALMGHCEPEENIDYRNDSKNNTIELDRSFDPEAAREAVTQLENRVQSMILRKGDGTWQCKVCGKSIQGRQAKGNMKQHVETHIEGISHTCTTCGKTYKNRNSLHTHISMKHRYGLDCTNTVQSIMNSTC